MGFDKSQKQAIQIKKGPVLVLAGPGSGKTTVITGHVQYLLDNDITKDENVLVVTFTKNAAKEMQDRFNELTQMAYPNVTFGTFHSIYFQIAKEIYPYNETNVLDSQDRPLVIKRIAKKILIEIKDEKNFLSKLGNEISIVKSECYDINTYEAECCEKESFRLIYKEYQNELQANDYIDYDDMLLLCYKVLTEHPDILQKYQDKYKHILVDEFQDTNTIQFNIIKMLALPENNLFVVGDDDQSIYKFRGARPEIMLDFPNLYPKCKVKNLNINYRSTPAIVNASQLVIKKNKKRFDKELNPYKKTGEDVYICNELNQFTEANSIVEKIKENIALGVSPSEIAIIYRTMFQAPSLTEVLLKNEIPFYIRDGVANVYEHWAAKDVLAYVHLAMGKPENINIPKIINKPKRYVENKCLNALTDITIDNLIDYYEKNSEKDWLIDGLIKFKGHLGTLQTMSRPVDILSYIYYDIGYIDYIKEYCEKNNDNYDDIVLILNELLDTAKEYNTCDEWIEYIVNFTKEIDDIKQNNRHSKNTVNLMTMHASKGLEFEVVFIVDANETITPSYRAYKEDDIEEERRMFYVAMTRAKSRLYIYSIKEKNGKFIEISRFIKELKHELKVQKDQSERDKILAEMQKTQETIDRLSKEEKIVKIANIDDILNEGKPQPISPKPIIDGIDTTREVYHTAFENGYIQKEQDGKLHIFFVKRNKILVLNKEFCDKYKMLYYFE